jgi:hypothetical protein
MGKGVPSHDNGNGNSYLRRHPCHWEIRGNIEITKTHPSPGMTVRLHLNTSDDGQVKPSMTSLAR